MTFYRIREIAAYFTRLGFTAFGGPAAHIAMMEEELVRKRQWLDRKHFLDLMSAINLIPGPNSTELAIAIGRLRGGRWGMIIAGICFIFPAMLIILPIGWLYVTYRQTPRAAGALAGISAAIVAIIAVAAVRLGKTAMKSPFTIAIAVLAASGEALSHFQHWTLGDVTILALAAVAGIVRASIPARSLMMRSFAWPTLAAMLPASASIAGPLLMVILFLQIGATLFGSGYVLVTYLQSSFVDREHWLTAHQVLDAVAVGQVTPGPLLTTATFVGFVLGHDRFGGGLAREIGCAIAATVAIFAPAFVLIALLGSWIERLRQNQRARAALDAMNAAVVGLIAATCVFLAARALEPPDVPLRALIMAGSLAILLLSKLNSTWLIAVAGLIGWVWLG